jgi:hypothetical protein
VDFVVVLVEEPHAPSIAPARSAINTVNRVLQRLSGWPSPA